VSGQRAYYYYTINVGADHHQASDCEAERYTITAGGLMCCDCGYIMPGERAEHTEEEALELPSWYVIAVAELGVQEIEGRKHNPRILEYHNTTAYKATKDETPWCAAFVNWVLWAAGFSRTESARAVDFAEDNWKCDAITEPEIGDIVVFAWLPRASRRGHVGFYAGKEGDKILVLGGNQKDEDSGGAVTIAPFSTKRVIGYFRPKPL